MTYRCYGISQELWQLLSSIFLPSQAYIFLTVTIYISSCKYLGSFFSPSPFLYAFLSFDHPYSVLGLPLRACYLWAVSFAPLHFLGFIIVNLQVLKVNEVVGGWLGTGLLNISDYQAFPKFRASCKHEAVRKDRRQTYSYPVKYVVRM